MKVLHKRGALTPALAALALAGAVVAQEAAVDFSKDVEPILRERCWDCHGADEPEADLRLDVRAGVFDTDRDPLVVPGDPDASLLLQRIVLPADDPDLMPADGEPLSAAQIEIVRRWIAEGAAWPETDAPAGAVVDATLPVVSFDLAPLDAAAAAAREAALLKLGQQGALATVVAEDTDAVDVSFALQGPSVSDGELALLDGLEPVLVWLDLSRTGVTEAGVARLERFAQLRRLNLSQTQVGDAAVAKLRALPRLEVLNLFGTQVTDAATATLAELDALRVVYLWQTGVTSEGVATLRAARPGIKVDVGADAQAIRDVTTALAPVNAKCPLTGDDIDPVFTHRHEDTMLAFCCNNCREKFIAKPEDFAEQVAKTLAEAAEPTPAPDGVEAEAEQGDGQ
ncbi:MAG: c-type cytochrome domain-containing protein [Planctomycetota bacterium]